MQPLIGMFWHCCLGIGTSELCLLVLVAMHAKLRCTFSGSQRSVDLVWVLGLREYLDCIARQGIGASSMPETRPCYPSRLFTACVPLFTMAA